MHNFYFFLLCSLSCFSVSAQTLQDDFEGTSPIATWYADDALLDTSFDNPYINAANPSAKVLRYEDLGGLYANVGFNSTAAIRVGANTPFRLKIYIPSAGTGGNQPNQISLKLQNANLGQPWVTQSEVIKPLVLDSWQEVTFDFVTDNYLNLDPGSPPPSQRMDFNRVVLQVNGENNTAPVIAFIDDFFFEGENQGSTDDPVYDQLVWQDEFDGNGAIDGAKWFHQTLLPNGESWFNGEVQHYTDRTDNAYVGNGQLHLVAKKENYTDQGVTKSYTSARLNSKFAFTYGRVEARAKLPSGVGTWPAIWMLGKNVNENGGYWQTQGFGTTGWPACGEIDIMEHWGHNQNFVQSAMHTPSSFGATVNLGGQFVATASTAFHVYALDWYPDRMVFSVDGVVHYVYAPEVQNADTWPFNADQYLLLNIAIQPSIFPAFTEGAMEIDYVRVYQEKTNGTTAAQSLPSLTVVPNPAHGFVQINCPREAIGGEVQIYDAQSKLIKAVAIRQESTPLDTSGWLPGIYFFKYQWQGYEQVVRVVKM